MPLLLAFSLVSCTRKPIPLPPPPKPVQLTTTTTDNTQAQTHILKGWYHAHRQEWTQARQSFQLAIQENPGNPWTYIQIGHAEYQYGHATLAREAWRKAKEMLLPTELTLHAQLNTWIEREEVLLPINR